MTHKKIKPLLLIAIFLLISLLLTARFEYEIVAFAWMQGKSDAPSMLKLGQLFATQVGFHLRE